MSNYVKEEFPFCEDSLGILIDGKIFCERENVELLKFEDNYYLRCKKPYFYNIYLGPSYPTLMPTQAIDFYERKNDCCWYNFHEVSFREVLEYPSWLYKDSETANEEINALEEKAKDLLRKRVEKRAEESKKKGLFTKIKEFFEKGGEND